MNSTQPAAALLPCPFCGGEAEMMIESSYYQVGCTNEDCYAMGNGGYTSRDEAVSRWNRRAQQPQPVGVPSEAVAEAIYTLCETFPSHWASRLLLTWLDAHRPQP